MTKKFHDEEYLNLIERIFRTGTQKGDRTGTGTISTFAQQMRFDLTGNSIPLLTTKLMHTKSIIHELLWFLAGDTNVDYLKENGVRIWNEWADENGDLGPIYGAQWRKWKRCLGASIDYSQDPPEPVVDFTEIDQIANVVSQLRNNPDDRRIIVSAWNVGEIEDMALPPCHAFFQFWSAELPIHQREAWFMSNVNTADYDCPISDEEKHKYLDEHDVPRRELKCHLYQRSCDVGLGVPFNIAQYSILVHMMAQVTNHVATEFIWTGGDTHIYNNHIDQLAGQLDITPFESPKLLLNREVTELENFKFEDFKIIDYVSHPTIKMEVSV